MYQITLSERQNVMNYAEYRQQVADLFANNRASSSTDPAENSEEKLHYAQLNIQRMNRLDKTTKLLPETLALLTTLQNKQTWLVLSEGWCGDAAQVVPVFQKIAEASEGKCELRMIFRDEHPDIMNAFLTNGGKSIPKLIALDENGKVVGDWGPRPKVLFDLFAEWRKAMLLLPQEQQAARFEEMKLEAQNWYNANKTVSIQNEFSAAIALWDKQ